MRSAALRRTIATAFVAAIGITTAACGGGADAESPGTVHWRLAESQPEDYPTARADQWFADQLEKRSGGRIQIEVYPDAQLGSERDVLEQMQLGSIEVNRTNANLLGEFVPSWTAFGLPYVFDNEQHLWRFLNGPGGDKKLDELGQMGVEGLTYYDSGARSLYTKGRPVEKPEDLAGRNIRVQPGSVAADIVEAFGGSATTMDSGEVYSGIETGVIDGAENNIPTYASSGHYEVAESISLNEHQRVPEVLMVGQDAMNTLSEQDQQLVRDVAKESTGIERRLWKQEVADGRKTLEDAGITINEVDEKPFRDAVAGMMKRYSAEYGDFMEAVEAARK